MNISRVNHYIWKINYYRLIMWQIVIPFKNMKRAIIGIIEDIMDN